VFTYFCGEAEKADGVAAVEELLGRVVEGEGELALGTNGGIH
jgi:hypothetical protein